MTHVICGVDVSSKTLDVRVGRDGPHKRFPRTTEGIAELAAYCRDASVTLVAMEATGGYERLAYALLWDAGLPVAIVNPRAVRDFAKGMGFLEKTDAIDAAVIARYAEVRGVAPQPPPGADQRRLTALVKRLRQLVDVRTSQRNQRRLVEDAAVLASFDALIKLVNTQIADLEGAIEALLGVDPLWLELGETFRSIKGVAGRTIACLMAFLPEIGTLSNKAVAKLAGLAPLASDSGQTAGRRHVRGGRREVRDILFVVAEIVRRHDPDFKAFHQKLSQAGKPKKVIRVALAHKLLTRLNAKAREVRNAHALPA